MLQSKVLPVGQHPVQLLVVLVLLHPMVVPLSTHKLSQHTVDTQATHQQQQPPLIQAMVAATPRLVHMVATPKSQQLLMVVRAPTAGVGLVDMIHMALRGSSHMEVQVAMVSKVPSPAHSQQEAAVVVVSGRSSQTMKADHTTITRSQVSVSGTAQLTCKAAQLHQQPQHYLQTRLNSRQHRSGKAEYSCAWLPSERVMLPISVAYYLLQLDLFIEAVEFLMPAMGCNALVLGARCLQVCRMPECLVRCHTEVLDA